MSLNWNEIRDRARAFSKEWANDTSEHAEAKSFWDAFFTVFGIPRRRVASFESPAVKSDGRGGFIDLLWKGVMLVEHKSAGKDLTTAAKQALNYFPGLKDRDLPRYVVVSDFKHIRLYDLEAEIGTADFNEFELKDLYKHVTSFSFMLGNNPLKVKPEDPVNQKAILRLSALHDELERSNYDGPSLESLLTRLVFCFFADDTGIFGKNQFKEWIEANTLENGSDTGSRLIEIFGVLKCPEAKRSRHLSEELSSFRYVNGGLFNANIAVPAFDQQMREALLDACGLEWSQISPAIFGALFQGLMDKTERHKLGAHYTREQNILRVIGPLFMDELRVQFEASKTSKAKLRQLHERMRKMRFLDPAMGSGNFAVVSYRELRKLELEILRIFYNTEKQQMLPGELDQNVWINVDQFYGIEIDEKATHIARLALWLTDHQMNLEIGIEFATPAFARLPLVTSPTIMDGNALLRDWASVLAPVQEDGGEVFVLGNPPFLGSKNLIESQRSDVNSVMGNIKNSGNLDFVAAWYVKAARYIAGTNVRCAFVSTNSITQGDQVGILWDWLLKQGIHIDFAHRTFQWSNEARGQAQVHCVIIGFGMRDRPGKVIYEYPDIKGVPNAVQVSMINPYLVEATNVVCLSRTSPLCKSPTVGIGNKPIDGGFYLFEPEEKAAFLKLEPRAMPLFKLWLGSEEFINGKERWCLLVSDCKPSELRAMPRVFDRVEAVQAFRRGTGPNSKGKMGKKKPAADTVKLGDTPTKFHVTNRPNGNFLILPRHSSESRRYVPIGFGDPSTLVGDACLISSEATHYDFGVLTSAMYNAWIRYTCGRIKSDFRLSARVVYNNFPWPEPSATQRARIEHAAKKVLDVRQALHIKGQTLADLYDHVAMDPDLLKAHRELDNSVDAAYSRKRFDSERDRVLFLFEMYSDLVKAP